MTALEKVKERLELVTRLERVGAVLRWEQSTYMPSKGTIARARQLATLEVLGHTTFVDPETARLLDDADVEADAAGLSDNDDDRCLLRVARRDYRIATALPTDLVQEMAQTTALAYDAWVAARSADEFSAFAPWLQKTIDLSRRKAELLGYQDHPYDALLDLYEPGMTVARLIPLLTELRDGIRPLLAAIRAHDTVDPSVLRRGYDEAAQLRFARDVSEQLGFDYARGRLDQTAHPFATAFSVDDVRLTTRTQYAYFPACLMGTIHEAGHGMYEQNIAPALDGAPLASASSLGVHESQSRLWENVVGRSRGFWERFMPLARQTFPAQLGDVDVATLYRAINYVSPSEIRVEADEVTYNLHIMIRFELETRLMTGELAVSDVPEAWNAATEEYLGMRPSSDQAGVLQDMHWSAAYMGYFPTYTLGNVLSVQLCEAAKAAHPSLDAEMADGQYTTLFAWLRENIYRHGRKYDPDELVSRATGRTITAAPYLAYLRDKYTEIYEL